MKLNSAVVLLATCSLPGYPEALAKSKERRNFPFVKSFFDGEYYARCIPLKDTGSEGFTQVFRVRRGGDEIVNRYPWYNRQGVSLAWSPKVGKIALLRVRQDWNTGKADDSLVVLSFYLDGRLLRSYTAKQLLDLGAKKRRQRGLTQKEVVDFEVLGSKQVDLTNDYSFVVQLSKTERLYFDVLTGDLQARSAEPAEKSGP